MEKFIAIIRESKNRRWCKQIMIMYQSITVEEMFMVMMMMMMMMMMMVIIMMTRMTRMTKGTDGGKKERDHAGQKN